MKKFEVGDLVEYERSGVKYKGVVLFIDNSTVFNIGVGFFGDFNGHNIALSGYNRPYKFKDKCFWCDYYELEKLETNYIGEV